ncbi:MAG TPA: ribonuclease HII [Acidimicrobiales bacterium]|nr:ribonuclease HII [Acidimicrobiales bacterium]
MPEESRDLFDLERPLWQRGLVIAGVDEVGRGALAGPLMVGAVLLEGERVHPEGLDDSKRLTARRREALVPEIRTWCDASAVGSASAAEIDERGLTSALRLAGWRALRRLKVRPTHVLLDGAHDFLTPPAEANLLEEVVHEDLEASISVTTVVRGDSRSALIAAASVLAKVERDALMCAIAPRFVAYGWSRNKGYGSPSHLEALRDFGPSTEHRTSWRLPMKKPS